MSLNKIRARFIGYFLFILLLTPAQKNHAQKLKIEPIKKARALLKGVKGIAIWTRGAGDHTKAKGVAKVRVSRIFWKKLRLQKKVLQDIQYDKKVRYRGLYVRELLKKYKPSSKTDLAILHFTNGMAIPYPLKTVPGRNPLRVFVAISMRHKKKWTQKFPMVERTPPLPIYKDNNPVMFAGNKVVVASNNHPMTLDHVVTNVKLWQRPSSLRGIELVQSDAYYKQFQGPNKKLVRKGWRMYMGTCQFCHGVRKIGASFGPDFVKPLAMYLYAFNTKELHYHITYKSMEAMNQGKAMPAIKNMPRVQVRYLWHWLKAIARQPSTPYLQKPTKPKKKAPEKRSSKKK